MRNKVMTWVLVLTLLVSQSYVYASVPCMSDGDAISQHNNEINSMGHDMSSHMQQQELVMECCDDQECNCLTGTCASVTLTLFSTATSVPLLSEPLGFYLFSIPDAFLPSLSKPPIIG